MIWWVIILFLAGATLITVEFVVPGGICGSAGALLIIVSAVMGCYHYPEYWLPILMLEFLGTLCSVILGMYLLPRSPFGKLLMLGNTQNAEEGWVNETGNTDLVGRFGTVVAPPPGRYGRVRTERLQAVSKARYQPAPWCGSSRHGNRLSSQAEQTQAKRT